LGEYKVRTKHDVLELHKLHWLKALTLLKIILRLFYMIFILHCCQHRNPVGPWIFAGGMESTTGYWPPVWDLLLALA
jgi:hypothetical protein